jgi:predicted lipoprotein with Yx(FWY)xxD motif
VRRSLVLGIFATAAVALLAGCGSSSSSSSSSSAAATTPATTQSTAESTSTIAAASATAVGTGSGKLGTMLVAGPEERTVYLWLADKGSSSTCYGACAQAWPPVTTEGKPTADGEAKSAMLGTTKRTDGTEQVTYNGHPLYYFEGDKAPGQTTGQDSKGFGAEWDVMSPNGNRIDEDSGKGGSDDGDDHDKGDDKGSDES